MVKNIANIEECCKLLNKYFIDREIISYDKTFIRDGENLKVYMSAFIATSPKRHYLTDKYKEDKNKYINYVIEHIGPFLIDYNIENVMFTCLTDKGPMYLTYKISIPINPEAIILTQIGGGKTETW